MTISERILSELARFKSETGRPAQSVYLGLSTWVELCGDLGVSMLSHSLVFADIKVYRLSVLDHDSMDHLNVG